MIFIDSHTHLQFPQYDEDRDKVLRRAIQERVHMVNVGTNEETSRKALELCTESGLYATVGVHPTEFKKGLNKKVLREMAKKEKVVAIGECGLDYFRMDGDSIDIKEEQRKIFLDQVDLAKELDLPLMIHSRPSPESQDAYEDIFEILKSEVKNLKGIVMHFFAGNIETARKFMDIDCYFTFGGVITFVRDYDEIINLIPLNRMMMETDAPYVTPHPHRGKRNEPAFVIEVYKKMAELKGINLEDFSNKVLENNKRIFNIDIKS